MLLALSPATIKHVQRILRIGIKDYEYPETKLDYQPCLVTFEGKVFRTNRMGYYYMYWPGNNNSHLLFFSNLTQNCSLRI
jgi:hypothetical protein